MSKRQRSGSMTPGSSKSSPSTRQLEKMMMKKLQREIEKKGVDTPLAINGIIDTYNTNGDIYLLNGIDAGTQAYQRVGRKVRYLSLRVKGVANLEGVTRANVLRMIVVWDKQPNGALPTYSQIFGNTDAVGITTQTLNSQILYDQMDRFKILRDKTMPMNIASNATATELYAYWVEWDEYINLKGLESVYNDGNAGTIADINSGAIYLIFRAAIYDATNSHVDVNCVARLRYTD